MTREMLVAILLAACSRGPDEAASPRFVGGATCAECHPAETAAWRGSHHDLAMQEATEATVLGNFDDATISYAGVTSTFFRRGEWFFVRTDGPVLRRQVPHMAEAGDDLVARAQIFVDGLGLGGRFDDDDLHGALYVCRE